MIRNITEGNKASQKNFYGSFSAKFVNEGFYLPGSYKFFQGIFHKDYDCLPPIRRENHSWRIDPMVYMSAKYVSLSILESKSVLPCSTCFHSFIESLMSKSVQ